VPLARSLEEKNARACTTYGDDFAFSRDASRDDEIVGEAFEMNIRLRFSDKDLATIDNSSFSFRFEMRAFRKSIELTIVAISRRCNTAEKTGFCYRRRNAAA